MARAASGEHDEGERSPGFRAPAEVGGFRLLAVTALGLARGLTGLCACAG